MLWEYKSVRYYFHTAEEILNLDSLLNKEGQ